MTREQLTELARQFWDSRVFLTGFELGVFTALGRGPRPASRVAAAVKADPRAMGRLLSALCVLGLLRKRGRLFANTPLAQKHLVSGRAGHMGGLGHFVSLWRSWSTLTDAVRRGRSVLKGSLDRRGRTFFSPFIAAMHQRALPTADSLVRGLGLSGVSRVLDMGGGSGAYALAFARARPGLRAVVFDLPQVVPLTRSYIKEAGLSDQVSAAPGDYEKDPFPKGFDLVFLSAVIHSCSPSETLRLFRKSARALNPGGRIVVVDFIMSESRTAPAFGALFSLNMLVGTRGGDTYTRSEVSSWLRQAGFGAVSRRDTPFGTTVLTARLR